MNRSDEPEYMVWKAMRARCQFPAAAERFTHYGGRGIAIDPSFESYDGFVSYLKAAGLYPRPSGKSLDRIDVNGDYVPGNLKWSTPTEQNRNARSNRRITYEGETLCLSEWAERLGMPVKTLYTRLVTRKWPVERAFTMPVQAKSR